MLMVSLSKKCIDMFLVNTMLKSKCVIQASAYYSHFISYHSSVHFTGVQLVFCSSNITRFFSHWGCWFQIFFLYPVIPSPTHEWLALSLRLHFNSKVTYSERASLITLVKAAAAAAAKSLQSCLTLCDPIDRSPPRLPRPWDSPGKSTGVGCHFLLQCMKIKSESEVVSDPQRPHGLQPSRLLHPWDSPSKSTGVGCHCLLPRIHRRTVQKRSSWPR